MSSSSPLPASESPPQEEAPSTAIADENDAIATTPPAAAKAPLPSAVEFEPPLACIRRILKNALPASTNVGKDASAAFARASGIFIIYLTACANDFARENKRQTITANDVLSAIKELDFNEFTPDMLAFLESYRQSEKTKKNAKAAAKKESSSSPLPLMGTRSDEDDDDEEEDDDDDEEDRKRAAEEGDEPEVVAEVETDSDQDVGNDDEEDGEKEPKRLKRTEEEEEEGAEADAEDDES